MKRMLAILVLCTAFSTGFVPQGEALPAPAAEASWPDSLRPTEYYTEGVKKLLIGEDTLAARALFLQALELDSAYAPAWFRLSSVTPDGDPQGTAWARRAYRLDSLNKWYGQLYGQKLLAEGELDKARPLFVRLSALDPTNPDNIRILAILYQQAGMPYSAIDMLDSAEMRFGKMPLLGAMKRQLLIRTGQLDRALAEAREMAEAIPYEAENHVILADLYGAAKQDSLAIAEYNRALEIDSMNVPALASLAEFYNKRNDSHAYLAVSKRLFEIDELPLSEKVRIFRQLTLDVRFYRDNFFQLNDLISTLAIRYPDDKDVVELYAQHLINAGKLEQALTLYKLHLADQPPQLDYYRAVIDIETYRKRLDSVYLYIDRALEVFPGNTELCARKGHAQGYAGKLSQSIGSYKKALKYADTDSLRGAVWGYIGDVYHQMEEAGRKDSERDKYRRRCFEAYDRSLHYYYDNPMVLNNYAYFISESSRDPRQLDRAFAMAARAVELDGNNATLLDTYAWVLFRLGRLQEARRTMQQAISFDRSENPELYLHYGDILAALGEKFMAETYWRKALEKGYDDPRAIEERIRQLKSKP